MHFYRLFLLPDIDCGARAGMGKFFIRLTYRHKGDMGMKPPEEIISIEKKPEIQKPPFSAGKVIKAAVDIAYIIFFAVIFWIFSRENIPIPKLMYFIISGPFAVGQYCDQKARGNGAYAEVERTIAAGITVFELALMAAAVMAFGTGRAGLYEHSSDDIPKSYGVGDISALTVEIYDRSNAPRYYVYNVDMDKRKILKTTYSYAYSYEKGGSDYEVSSYVSNNFSEKQAEELRDVMDEAFLTKWSSAYLPKVQDHDGGDRYRLYAAQYNSFSHGGRKVFSVEYSDGGSQMTVIYDDAENEPKYCGRLLDCVCGLLRKDRGE